MYDKTTIIEISTASKFFTEKITKTIPEEVRNKFYLALVKELEEKYKNHWYVETPRRGQAYRTILFDSTGFVDNTIQNALRECGLSESILDLDSLFPTFKEKPVQVWVDPYCVEVAYLKSKKSSILYQQAIEQQPVYQQPQQTTQVAYHQQNSGAVNNYPEQQQQQYVYYSPPASPPLADMYMYQQPRDQSPVYYSDTVYYDNAVYYDNMYSCGMEATNSNQQTWEYSTYVQN